MLKHSGNVRLVMMVTSALAGSLAVADPSAAPQDRPTFRAGVARVAVTAVVRTRDGRPVTDLRPEEFELLDAGERRKIDVQVDESPVRLALLVDARMTPASIVARGFSRPLVTRVQKLVVRSQFKRRLPLIAKVSTRSIGWDFRYPRDWRS